jgi:phospholipid/cholesterol/gamma-HCH transport system permease protein
MASARHIEVSRVDDGTGCVHLAGGWHLRDGLPSDEQVARDVEAAGIIRRLTFEAKDLTDWDSSLVTFLAGLIDSCRARGVAIDYAGLPEGMRRLLALAAAVPEAATRSAPALPWLARRGNEATALWRSMEGGLAFIGEVALACAHLATGRARHRRADLYYEIQKAGARALPIVTLISVLLGMIVAFVGGETLRAFGAATYVADVVAVGMVRELGAIMTAIVMAGRTGSAYAAELGAMGVSQELDALATMGIPPVEFIVLNRLLALSVMMPLLCVYADFLGILGGGIVATQVLGLSAAQYAQRIRDSITLTTFAIGVTKGAVFGIVVAMCGCLAGLKAGRSAAAVGEAATIAVVSAIVGVIVIDGLLAIVFYEIGI